MRRSFYTVPLACAIAAGPLRAQAPATPVPLPATDRVYFPYALERLAAGKPVPLVAVSLGNAMGRPQPALQLDGKEIQEALSAIADAYSDHLAPDAQPFRRAQFEAGHETLVPYTFAKVWTIARDHQWQFNEHPDVPDVLDAVAQTDLLPRLVYSLSDAQLQQATSSGLRFSDLSKQQQAVFRAAFRSPVRLFTVLEAGPDIATPRRTIEFDGVLPFDQCSLWLNIAFDQIYTKMEPGKPENQLYSYQLDTTGKMASITYNPTAPRGYTFPLLTAAPAKLKPGDLAFDDKVLNAPIGVSGIVRLDKAVQAAAKATGLALRVDPRFSGDNVMFIGDATLRTGDVLRVIAFDVQGAWRRVGDAVLLTFDRAPLAPVLANWEGQLEGLNKDRDALLDKMLGPKPDESAGDERLLRRLGPDPNGPPGPNADQIEKLLIPEKTPTGILSQELKYTDLTTDQQTAVLLAMRTGRTHYSPDPDSPVARQLLPTAAMNFFTVRMTLDVPKFGRYKVQGLFTRLAPSSITSQMEIKSGKYDPPAVAPDEQIALTQKTRAVAVPPLSRSEWPRLFTQMHRKGLDTLYLPVLWDGYTMYPSKQFPLLPLAKGSDMLADVLAQSTAQNVRVIAVLHTLAWRNPGGGDLHWLRKHPELVDTDVSGIGRRDWTNSHLKYLVEHKDWNYGRLFFEDALLYSDMVKPASPAVRARLLGALAELKAYRGISGVALAEWARVSAPNYETPPPGMIMDGPPGLGYSVSERAAFIKEHSTDPEDFSVPGLAPVDIPTFSARGYGNDLDNAWAAVRKKEDADLLKALDEEAEIAWPGQVHMFSALELTSIDDHDGFPKPDFAIRGGFTAFANPAAFAWFAPAPDIIEGIPDKDGKVMDRLTDLLQRMKRQSEFLAKTNRSPNSGVVLDFRAAPSLLWDGLARLATPEPSDGPPTARRQS